MNNYIHESQTYIDQNFDKKMSTATSTLTPLKLNNIVGSPVNHNNN